MYQTLYGGFKRLKAFPIDESSFYDKYDDALKYAQDLEGVAFIGQPIVVKGDIAEKNGLYLIVISTDKKSRELLPVSVNESFKNRLTEIEKILKTTNENLDTFQEVSDWIAEHEEAIGDINDIIQSGKITNLASFIRDIEDRVHALESATLDEKQIVDIVNKTDIQHANKTMIIPLLADYQPTKDNSRFFDLPVGTRITTIDIEINQYATTEPEKFKIYFYPKASDAEPVYILNAGTIDGTDEDNNKLYITNDIGTKMFSYDVYTTIEKNSWRPGIGFDIFATDFSGTAYVNYFQTDTFTGETNN